MYISTEHILSVIDEHADSTALLLLPGIRTLLTYPQFPHSTPDLLGCPNTTTTIAD
jgi:hypothetical protein